VVPIKLSRVNLNGDRDPAAIQKDRAEAELAASLAAMFADQYDSLMEVTSPEQPSPPADWWDEWQKELAAIIALSLLALAEQGAEQAVAYYGIGVDWDAILNGSQQWASNYSYELVRDLTATNRAALQNALSRFYSGQIDYQTMVDSLASRFGPTRAAAIASTETTRSFEQGIDMYQQELEGLGLSTDRVWWAEADACPLCLPYHGVLESEGWLDGPPPIHTNCLTGDALVLPVGAIAAGSKRLFKGDVIILNTPKYNLTVTPNHPILTPRGWVGAGSLNKGDKIWCYSPTEWEQLAINVNNVNVVAPIKKIFGSLGFFGFRVPTTAPDFHNDGANSEVAIIRPNRKVMDWIVSGLSQITGKLSFGFRGLMQRSVAGNSSAAQFGEVGLAPAGSLVRGGHLQLPLSGVHLSPFQQVSLGTSSGSNAVAEEKATDDTSRRSDASAHIAWHLQKFLGKGKDALAVKVELQEVTGNEKVAFAGHVYNLQTESELYVANGIITHNCRCWSEIVVLPGDKMYHQVQKAKAIWQQS
jgi:hypothetical protein